jgi:hypothetical protein
VKKRQLGKRLSVLGFKSGPARPDKLTRSGDALSKLSKMPDVDDRGEADEAEATDEIADLSEDVDE